jgi:hypothetical protein
MLEAELDCGKVTLIIQKSCAIQDGLEGKNLPMPKVSDGCEIWTS